MSTARPLMFAYLVGSLMPDALLEAGAELVDGIGLGRPTWHADGACRRPEHSGVNFFPQRGEDARPAKAVCAACPVRTDCLDQALSTGEKHGIWGGLSERERRRIRGQRHREGQPASTIAGRRRRVVELRADGLSHREIAEQLAVSSSTVALDLRALANA